MSFAPTSSTSSTNRATTQIEENIWLNDICMGHNGESALYAIWLCISMDLLDVILSIAMA